MIPESKKIRKACHAQSIRRLPHENYFAHAEEFVNLSKEFVPETLFAKCEQWFEMIIYPFYMVYKSFTGSFSIFYITSIYKCIQTWIRWFRFEELKEDMRKWVKLVRSVGGPFISTNDPNYHVYVYADGMERIQMALKR
jgi:hypothetical protein